MNKLISNNPIQRFKQGQKIQKFQNAGQLTYHGNPVIKKGAIFIPQDPVTKKYNANIQLTNAELDTKIGKGNSNGRIYKSADGNWYQNGKRVVNFINSKPNKAAKSTTSAKPTTSTGNSFKTAFDNARNANQREFEWNGTRYNTRRNGETEEQWLNNIGASSNTAPTLSNTYVGYATPETSRVQNVNQNWTYNVGNTSGGFVPTQSSAQKLDEGPSFYGEGLTDFNRGSIRGFRNQDGGFRNVDEYYTWLNNNQNSDQYKLWNNVLEGMDDETRRNTFYQIMNQFGISGNLGRRDSGRLAEVLNTLRDLGVNGSANQKAFMNSYNTALNNELAEAKRNASPATSYTEQLRNQIQNARPSLATPPFIISPRYDENGRPLTYKKGGLISKNPVEQFKANFRKGAL